MAWPLGQASLKDAFQSVNDAARTVKQRTQNIRDAAASGPVNRFRLINLMGELTKSIAAWNAAAATPGIAQYVRDQYGNQAFDVAAEFTAMVGAATTLRDWIETNFPKTGNAWLVYQYSNDGQQIPLTFTQAQLTQFVIEADALLETIA